MPSKRDPKTGRFLRQKGMYIDSKGYWQYSAGEHRGQRVHRVVAAEIAGRKLKPDEDVHHRNTVKLDNDPLNLKIMDHRDHGAVSAKQAWYFKTHDIKAKDEWDKWFDEEENNVPF